MKRIHMALFSTVLASSLGVSTEVMAHAGMLSKNPSNAAENSTKGEYLEGSSPLVAAAISHSCAHEAPYPDLTGAAVVWPMGPNARFVKKSSLRTNADTGVQNTVVYFEVGNTMDDNGTVKDIWTITGAKPRTNQTFKSVTPLKLPVTPYTDSHGTEVTEATGAALWTGGKMSNDLWEALEIKLTLPKFPTTYGLPGACASKAVIYFPVAQYCAGAKANLDQKKIMTWQLEPSAKFGYSDMGEVTFNQSPSITVVRSSALPAECTNTTTDTDPLTDGTIYIYPAEASIDKGFMADKLKLKPTNGTDAHGCIAPKVWHEAMGHCMAM